MASKRISWLAELKRRKVYQAAAAYVAAGASVTVAAHFLFVELFELGAVWPQAVGGLVLLGFPIALVLAWAYELRPEEPSPTSEAPPRPEETGTADPPGAPQVSTPSRSVSAETSQSSIAGVPDQGGWASPAQSSYGSSSATDLRPGLVVLPFDNLSPDPGDAWFSDGLTEEITAALSGLRSLRVISRTSAMQLKGSGKDVRTIGQELSVGHLLEGSVRKAGDRLRITAQLIEASTDTHLWSERYDGEMGDVFTIQERLARSIAEALRLQITPGEDRTLSARPIEDIAAYELYLRARQRTWEWTPGALDKARQEMLNGLDLAGPNPLLHAGLAYVYFQYVNVGIENDEYIRLAEEHANHALELDPGSGEAHLVLGLLAQAFRGDQRSSFRHFRCALERNPDDAHALVWLIVGHTLVGRIDDARRLAVRCREVDPLNPASRLMPVFVDVWGGHMEHGIDELTLWHQLEPESGLALFFSAIMLCHAGHRSEACTLLERHLPSETPDVFSRSDRMLFHALRAEPEGVLSEMTEQLATTGRRDPQLSYFLADIFAVAGLRREALQWLANAVDRGFYNHPFLDVHDPLLEGLRGDPEFERISGKAREQWLSFDG